MFDSELIGRIYEAAVAPELLPALLHDIADQIGSAGGLVMTLGAQAMHWTASPGIAEHVQAFFDEGWHIKGGRADTLVASNSAGFSLETDYKPPEMIEAMPVHRDFLAPRGLSVAAASLFQGVRDDAVMLSFEGFDSVTAARSGRKILDSLRPHFGRALSLAARMEQARNDAVVEALAISGIGAAVVDRQGRLRASNDGFELMFNDSLSVSTRDGMVQFGDPFVNAAVTGVREQRERFAGRSVPLKATEANCPVAAHIIPLRGRARDVAGSDGVLILLASAANLTVPGADLLKLMFDLTAAEARLARALVEGFDLAEAASRNHIAVGTARKQLAAVFAKVGVTRQVELVRLLGGLAMPRGCAV